MSVKFDDRFQRQDTLEKKSLSMPNIEIIESSKSIDCDIVDKIDNFMSVEELIKYLCDNKKNIFMPDKYFNTVFHILLEQARIRDFMKLADFIKSNKDIYNWEYEYLKQKFFKNIANCKFEIGQDKATESYTDLNADGYFQETDNEEIWQSIQFVRNELKQVASKIFSQIFNDNNKISKN